MKRSISVISLISLCLLMLALGCSVEEPGSPKWEVELTIPIADRVYGLSDLIADSTEVDSVGNWISSIGNNLIINFADSIEKVTLEDELTYDAIDETMESFLGTLDINDPGSDTTDFIFEELNAQSGQTVPFINEMNISKYPQDLAPFSEYDWAYLETGAANITVTNNLPVPLDALTIRVLNVNPAGIVLVEIIIPASHLPLLPDSSYSSTHDLPVETEIDNEMQVEIIGHSPGSATPVFIPDDNNIQVIVDLTPLSVIDALAHISTQSFFNDTTYIVEEDDIVTSARVREGTAIYFVENRSELINDVIFILHDFYNSESQAYRDTFRILPGGTYDKTVSLEGYEFRPEVGNTARAETWVDILDTADPLYNIPEPFVEVSENQSVYTEFTVSELVFSDFEGILAERTIEIEQDAVIFEDIPDGLEELEVAEATAELHLVNAIGAPVEIDLTFLAYKEGIVQETFHVVPPLQIPVGSIDNPVVIDKTIPGLEGIVNVLPDSILPVGEMRVEGAVDVSELQWVEGKFLIHSPFSFSILDTTTLEPELTSIDEGFDNPMLEAILRLHLTNHLPVSGEAYIITSFDSLQFSDYDSSGAKVDTFLTGFLPDAEIGPDGYVTEAGEAPVEVTLDEDQLEMFAGAGENEPLYFKTMVIVKPTTGIVNARLSDYITVGASATVYLEIGEDDNGGGQ